MEDFTDALDEEDTNQNLVEVDRNNKKTKEVGWGEDITMIYVIAIRTNICYTNCPKKNNDNLGITFVAHGMYWL